MNYLYMFVYHSLSWDYELNCKIHSAKLDRSEDISTGLLFRAESTIDIPVECLCVLTVMIWQNMDDIYLLPGRDEVRGRLRLYKAGLCCDLPSGVYGAYSSRLCLLGIRRGLCWLDFGSPVVWCGEA